MVAVVIVATMFVLFLVFNIFSGYAADDYLYFFKYAGHTLKGTPQRLTGIGDIIAGMKVHYKICNGRIPAHFMLQLFALSGKTVFNVFNSLVFVLLGLLVYFHANIKGKLNIPLLILYMLLNGWERICRRQSTFGLAVRSIICGQLLSFWRFL